MTFVLIPGAGCTPWHWRPLTAELTRRGHDVVPVTIPWQDPEAGLTQYVDAVVEAVGDRTDLTVVGHSLGGITAPLVCERLPVRLLVFLAGMTPRPGETVGDWWTNTGYVDPGPGDTFFHDLPTELAAEGRRQLVEVSGGGMADPWPLERFPAVPTRAVIGREDRFFPAEFLRRVTLERLGLVADEMPGAHFPMLGHPVLLADLLESYLRAEPTGP
ncbi:alpha/beta hydrolase [Kribbella sp. NBC_01245]|uniref:alpha/beta fold hydrolase n=1 Tax=Kribbella sp. NBC_01245 TaxID=2903578 RepID=UPI002E290498|nr:alpha/beta hydrolase [Kribbella sp. NBC_01245]